MEKYDLLVVGAGATGLHASRVASKNNLKTIMIETSNDIGGQISKFYPEKTISNLPFINDIIAKNLVNNMNENIKNQKNLKFLPNLGIDNIETINDEKYEKTFNVTFSNTKKVNFIRILLCLGAGQLEPIRADDFEYDNIIYNVKDLSQFANRKVIILGGGNSAIDFANEIVNFTKDVYLVHRREEFRTTQAEIDKMVKNKVNIFADWVVVDKEIINNCIKSILIRNNKNKEEKWIKCDKIIIAYGFIAKKCALKGLEDLVLDERKRIVVNENNLTSRPYIYAAGDCCSYKGKIWNILSTQYESEKAVLNIEKEIRKSARVIGW
ncbi:NAD(P)/FAD-dependent oxidoreductase [Spiroplasma endosymbiont of Aspidapion aeneum]|uniref:NAD(P)/FAD-dependent oxidoreductase n=1 Tax=Spiroplasma endosymbiont of Aspidapion aeneum TaxID=3066276 RepID=UPI00313D54F5